MSNYLFIHNFGCLTKRSGVKQPSRLGWRGWGRVMKSEPCVTPRRRLQDGGPTDLDGLDTSLKSVPALIRS